MVSGIDGHGTVSSMTAMQRAGKGAQMLQALRRGLARAEELVRNPKELYRLLEAAERRLERLDAGRMNPLKRDVQTMLRMLRASGEGRYSELSKKNLLLAAAGIAYLVSPIDVIPDFLPGGFADDAAVVTFVVRKLRGELAAFERWEQGIIDV
jgi:uncharacterized membrane protein YkvA (DUF1232 family)